VAQKHPRELEEQLDAGVRVDYIPDSHKKSIKMKVFDSVYSENRQKKKISRFFVFLLFFFCFLHSLKIFLVRVRQYGVEFVYERVLVDDIDGGVGVNHGVRVSHDFVGFPNEKQQHHAEDNLWALVLPQTQAGNHYYYVIVLIVPPLTHTTAGQSSKYKNETKIKIRS
jgi:hypothetical protein